MEAHIIIQGKDDPPKLELTEPILDLSMIPKITFALMEGAMASGEPSVLIIVQGPQGSVVSQTSFDKFLMSAQAMMMGAIGQWGWKRPEGYASLDPTMPKEDRKALLESIKKELEEWDDTEK